MALLVLERAVFLANYRCYKTVLRAEWQLATAAELLDSASPREKRAQRKNTGKLL